MCNDILLNLFLWKMILDPKIICSMKWKKRAFGSDKEYEVYRVSQKPFKTKAKNVKNIPFLCKNISISHAYLVRWRYFSSFRNDTKLYSMTLADRILLYALYYIHKYYIREAYVVPFSWNTRNTELKKRLPNWIQLAKFFENILKMCLDEKIWEKMFVINCSNSSIWTWIWRCSSQHLSDQKTR